MRYCHLGVSPVNYSDSDEVRNYTDGIRNKGNMSLFRLGVGKDYSLIANKALYTPPEEKALTFSYLPHSLYPVSSEVKLVQNRVNSKLRLI